MITLEELKNKISDLENTINYKYKNTANLILALTHSSFANEHKAMNLLSNERLEFLGDSVLNIVISERIYTDFRQLSEGELTRARAGIVCELSLMKCSNKIRLGEYLLLGKGEDLTGGRTRVSILSDAFEALIGSIYIDGGFEKAKAFILSQMEDIIEGSIAGFLHVDYKTQLQETIQSNGDRKITYEVLDEKGPDHNKVFVSQVKIGNEVMGTGEGRSKKEAEQNAARSALEKVRSSK
ncbi:MAG: ribonuclease III [Clostridia bacterium]|nr:ribonuclease III [Clostridia bacterium]